MTHGLWLHGQDGADVAHLVDCAVAAEDAGWDGVFVSDSLPVEQFADPWVLLAAMAERTETIALGTWVVPVPRRQPWQLAQEIATLDHLADGRLMLGVGLGNDTEYDAYGVEDDPAALGERFDEALDIITGLWRGEPLDYDGDHFTLDDATVTPTPVQQPRVPILAGCWWPNKRPFHRGARWDGIMPYFPSLLDDQEGPHGERASGSPEDEVREALSYYHDIVDDPGEILLPVITEMDSDVFDALCEEFDVTWTLTTELGEDAAAVLETIRAGPEL